MPRHIFVLNLTGTAQEFGDEHSIRHPVTPDSDGSPPHDWHLLDVDACLTALEADPDGLPASRAQERLDRYGQNVLEIESQPSAWRRLIRQFNNVLLYVLLGSAALTAGLGQWLDTAVIVGVVLINALVGFVQEGRAEQAMLALRSMLRLRALVLRAGRAVETDAAELVPGDVIILQAGDRVPADARLMATKHLETDQSILTGESTPTPKDTATLVEATPLPERANIVYAGTLVTRGWSKALVVGTGGETELGQISGALRSIHRLTTPLLERISVFARRLTLLILVLAGAIAMFGGLVHGYPTSDMLIAAVSIAVAAVPEGLPPVITITLAIGVQLMSRRHAVVRRLPAVETLGEVDVICTDKTGTLTANEMTTRTVVTADARFETTGIGFNAPGMLVPVTSMQPERPASLEALLLAALNCNDARLSIDPDGYTVSGDPTECALAVLAAKGGLDPEDVNHALPRLDVIPFESEQRLMATLHRQNSVNVAYVKGAPETVIALCGSELTEAEPQPVSRDRWLSAAAELAGEGERVLALARLVLPTEVQEISLSSLEDRLELLGIVGTMDPPRTEVPEALRRCRSAGIRVKMVTGDHARTASAVGRELGLNEDHSVLTGEDLDRLDDAAFTAAAESTDVFARTSPEHKLRLVTALQAKGHVVAMTGDGVNDAPALKRSDVGVAMGLKGTQAAREAAEVVLADDNFATIVRAVEAGRNIYENIRKSIVFLLPTSVTEALVIALAIVFGYQLPMTPVQILWINMITAVTLGIALAFEPGTPDVMRHPPRASRTPLLSGLVIWRTGFVSFVMLTAITWLFALEASQQETEYARTAAVNLLVLFEVVYLISSRHLNRTSFSIEGFTGNRVVLLSIAAVALFQVLFVYTAPFQQLFDSRPLSTESWNRIWLLGLGLFIVVELEKLLRRTLLGVRQADTAASPRGSR
jgi:magnesium-transporting ATPase (P-type)